MENVTALATRSAPEWTDEQKNLIKRTVAENSTDAELAMFLHVAKKSGLDPLQKQIWFVKRRQKVERNGREEWEEKVSIQAGVDGLQARALRQADCEGIQAAVVYAKDDFVFDKKAGEVVRHEGNPFGAQGDIVGAWAIVRRAGKTPFVALIRYSEYVDGRSFLWKNKPSVMIEKVARSTALRRAYPEDFAGIYDPAEMGKDAAHAEAEHAEPAPQATALPPRTVEAEIVQPEPKPEPKKTSPPPPHVMALWNRVKQAKGEAKSKDPVKTRAAFEEAATRVWGEQPKPSSEWTVEDVEKVETEILGPADVPF